MAPKTPISRLWHYGRSDATGHPEVFEVNMPMQGLGETVSLVDPYYGTATREWPLHRHILSYPVQALDADILILRNVSRQDFEAFESTLASFKAALKERVRRTTKVGLLSLRHSGSESSMVLESADLAATEVDVLLPMLRALELHGQLIASGAIRIPQSAHYQLPSGAHSDTFLRVADAFDSAAAVARLADWLLPYVTSSRCVLVADSWTLLPLLQELATRENVRRGSDSPTVEDRLPILAFPRYPDIAEIESILGQARILLAGTANATILLIVSVVSSGALAENIRVLTSGRLSEISLHLVALVTTEKQDLGIESFLHFPHVNRFAVNEGKECALCLDPQRRPVIRIDPKRYSEIVEPRATAQMLRASDAESDQKFWELADDADAVQLHVRDEVRSRDLHVWVDVPRLLDNGSWRTKVKAQLKRAAPECDLLLVPSNQSTESLLALARQVYGVDIPFLVCGLQDTLRDALRPLLPRKRKILILDDCLIRGTTIRGLHRLVQDLANELPGDQGPADDYTVSVFVVLARPEHMSVWDGVRDSLRQAQPVTLECSQLVLIPGDPCPWCQESDLLGAIRGYVLDHFPEDERRRIMAPLDERIAIIQRGVVSKWNGLRNSLFLCDRSGSVSLRSAERLTRHSVFGEQLSEHVAYAAVASTMQRIRDRLGRMQATQQGSAWYWNVTRIINAYHDPILQASFLRGARIPELYVPPGRGLRSSLKTAMTRALGQDTRQWSLLAAEHLWAAASMKYPPARHLEIWEACMPVIVENGGAVAEAMPAILTSAGFVGGNSPDRFRRSRQPNPLI